MKIYGHPWSLNTRKVLFALAEKQRNAELVLVDLPRGAQHAPAHVRRHPFAKAPVLEDGALVLYESQAILRHLDRTLPTPPLTPSAPFAIARMDQWLSVGAAYFEPAAHGLVFETIFKRVIGIGEPDAAAIDGHALTLARPLDVIDAWLAAHPYLAGDDFSLAELAWMPFLEYLDRLAAGHALIAARAGVSQWWARIRERPAWGSVARSGPQPPIGPDVAV